MSLILNMFVYDFVINENLTFTTNFHYYNAPVLYQLLLLLTISQYYRGFLWAINIYLSIKYLINYKKKRTEWLLLSNFEFFHYCITQLKELIHGYCT